jgi:hypothetical protein
MVYASMAARAPKREGTMEPDEFVDGVLVDGAFGTVGTVAVGALDPEDGAPDGAPDDEVGAADGGTALGGPTGEAIGGRGRTG